MRGADCVVAPPGLALHSPPSCPLYQGRQAGSQHWSSPESVRKTFLPASILLRKIPSERLPIIEHIGVVGRALGSPVKSLKITNHVMEKSLNFFGSSPSPSPKLQFEFYGRKSKLFSPIKVIIGFNFQHFKFRNYKSSPVTELRTFLVVSAIPLTQ